MTNATNNLIYKVTKPTADGRLDITVRLNDECENGHQDFAITADIYEKTERGLRNVGGGCCHDEILAVAPELAPFVRLHLSDYLGRPMYASANGFYHLKNGFNATKADDTAFPTEFCEYYRITPKQFKALAKCETELQYKIALQSLDIIDQWKVEADSAIALLESLTGQTFVVDSVRSQYTPPTAEEVEAENERIASGYYSAKAKRQREKAKADAIVAKMRQTLEDSLAERQLEFDVKCKVLKVGGPAALKASIFYNHTKTLAFNWSSLDQISKNEANRIISKLKLPEGVTATIAQPRY